MPHLRKPRPDICEAKYLEQRTGGPNQRLGLRTQDFQYAEVYLSTKRPEANTLTLMLKLSAQPRVCSMKHLGNFPNTVQPGLECVVCE